MVIKPQQVNAIFLEKKNLTKTVLEATFRVTAPDFSFEPGQYATIVIDQSTRRQYSFASSPTESPNISFVVDITPMGPGSKWFLELEEGKEVSMIAPLGDFVMEESLRKKVLVATGTGIVPFRSMLRKEVLSSSFIVHSKNTNELNSTNHEPSTMNYSLYWGLRHEEDMYWDDEFKSIAGQYTGFQYFLTLSKPTEHWKGLTGHVTEHVLGNEKDLQNCDFYLCGNKRMIMEMEKELKARNTHENQIKTDVFF